MVAPARSTAIAFTPVSSVATRSWPPALAAQTRSRLPPGAPVGLPDVDHHPHFDHFPDWYV